MISNFDDLAFNKYTYPKFTSHNRIKLKETLLTVKEIVEAVLAALDIFIGWPVAILIVVLLFRKQIEQLFGVLGERLRRISVFGTTAEFEAASERLPPPLREIARPKATGERVGEPEEVPNRQELQSEMHELLDEQDGRSRSVE